MDRATNRANAGTSRAEDGAIGGGDDDDGDGDVSDGGHATRVDADLVTGG
jgi:hypothetical protein